MFILLLSQLGVKIATSMFIQDSITPV